MEGEELATYFEPMMLSLTLYETRVDNEDIEDPLKTSIQDVAYSQVKLDEYVSTVVEFKYHQFADNIERVQIFPQENLSTFLNVLKTDVFKTASGEGIHFMSNFQLQMGETQVFHRRSVYNMLDLLGDFGGIFGSVYAVGKFVHMLVTGYEEEYQMLEHYFKVQKSSSGKEKRVSDETRRADFILLEI